MKLLFLLLLLINYTLLSQQNEVYQKLDSLFNKVDLLYNEYKSNDYSLTLSINEAKEIAEAIYELYSFHWTEAHNYIYEKSRQVEDEYIRSGGKSSIHKPAVKLRVIKEAIDEIMGKNFSEIIMTPYFFEVKILDIDFNNVYESDGKIYGKITMLCEIIDVIKGNHIFSKGDNIEVSLLKGWEVGPFDAGKIYFFPVRPWNCINGNCTEYSLKLFPIYFNGVSIEGCPCGIYPIEDNEIKNADFFQISELKWDNFQKEFKSIYILEERK